MKKNNVFKNIILLSPLLIIIAFFLGYYIGKTPILSSEISEEKIQKECIDDLRTAGLLGPLPSELNEAVGDVFEVGDSYVVVRPREHAIINPLGMTLPKEITITMNSDTETFLAHEKDQDVFIQEYEAYRKEKEEKDQQGESIEDMTAPDPYTYTEISQNDFNVSDVVRFFVGDNLLEDKDKFMADRIVIMNEVVIF